MTIDILHIIYHLGLSKIIDKVLVDITADDLHHKTSCIIFNSQILILVYIYK